MRSIIHSMIVFFVNGMQNIPRCRKRGMRPAILVCEDLTLLQMLDNKIPVLLDGWYFVSSRCMADVVINVIVVKDRGQGSQCLPYPHNCSLSFISPKTSNRLLTQPVEVFLMEISWYIMPWGRMCVYKAAPDEFLRLTWGKVILILAEHIQNFYGIILPTRTLEKWEKVFPATKHTETITFLYGIRKF